MASWTKDSSGNWQKTSDSKKNYTIVDGKKVEQTEAAKTPSATSSSTWNKDTVTLEEAKQQTKDVESGVIDVDKGTTSIETPATTETISLEQAAAQTETESANRITAAESAQASQNPTEVSKQVSTITSIDNNGNYAVTEKTATESTYNNLSTIKVGSSVKSAAQLDPVVKTETESTVVETGSVKSLYSIADPIDYSELNVSKSTTTDTVQLSDAAMKTFSEQEISAAELASSSTTTKPFALEEKYNNPNAINTENIINTTANAYDSVTGTIGKTVVVPAAKVADTIIEYADTSLESSDNKDYSKYESTSLYGESEYVLKEAPTQTIANATANAAEKTAGYYVGAVSGVKETVKETLDAGNVFEVMDEGSGPNYQVKEKKVSETAAAKFVLSAGETIALAPVTIPEAAIAFVKNPISSTKDFVVNTGESIIADPATGLGTVAGMLLTGSVIKSTVKVGKSAAGKVGEFANDIKISKVYEKQTATLNEFKTVPETIKTLPDVEISASKLSLVDVGYVKSAESFKLKNLKTADVVASKTIVKQNVIAKVETPESAVNYAENMAKLNELKTVPESVKALPDVEPVVARLGLVDIGKIKTAESFELKNASNKSILNKSVLDRDAFSIKNQIKENQNTIAKVETPESAINYAENLTILNELKSKAYRSDFTGDFFERMENPTFRVTDKRSYIRPKVDTADVTSVPEVLKAVDKSFTGNGIGIDPKNRIVPDTIIESAKQVPDVLTNFDKSVTGEGIGRDTKNRFIPDNTLKVKTESVDVLQYFKEPENIGLDTNFKKREWSKDVVETASTKSRKANRIDAARFTTEELSNSLLQKDYFSKKNMSKFIEDERGTVVLDRIIEDSKPKTNPTIGDLQKQNDSFTKEFKNPVEEAFQRPKRSEIERFTGEIRERPIERTKRSELSSSIEEKISSKGRIPSLNEQFRARAIQSQIPRSKAFIVPALAQTDLTAQLTEQLPAQTNLQQPLQMQQLASMQSLKQSPIEILDFNFNANAVSKTKTKSKGKKQTIEDPTKYISDPVISDSFVKPKRGRKSSDYPIVPSFVPTRKSKKSKKGKNSSSSWEYDRLYNTYGDATKWRGF